MRHRQFKTCPGCGANLDLGEPCSDCKGGANTSDTAAPQNTKGDTLCYTEKSTKQPQDEQKK